MDTRKVLKGCGYTIGLSVLGGVIGGATGALSGVVGASIMTKAGHAGYVMKEATRIGGIGCSILGAGQGFFSSFRGKKKNSEGSYEAITHYVGNQLLGGLVGYGILLKMGASTMTLGTVAIDMSVGAAVMAVPVGVGVVCCVGILAAGVYAVANNINNNTRRSAVLRFQSAAAARPTVNNTAAVEPEQAPLTQIALQK